MNTKTDSMAIKILEYLALVGEMSSDEICCFFKSESYVRKVLSALHIDKLIKKFKSEKKITYRLTFTGKKKLREYLPEVFEELLSDRKSMNVVRDDNGYKERRKKLLEILTLFHSADIKILPDEKVLLKKTSLNPRTDNTDTTDSMKDSQPEFYTSVEIKEIFHDFNIAKGSRSLGILISHGRIYIIYSTYNGELLWWEETEIKFRTSTRFCLSKPMFGNDEVYMLVFADKVSTVKEIVNRYGMSRCGKIHPSVNLPNMIFSLKDTRKDATLKIITEQNYYINDLEKAMCDNIEYDTSYPFFSGRTTRVIEEYYLHAYLFDLYRVAACIDTCRSGIQKVNFFCFDYQVEYVKSIFKKDDIAEERIKFFPISEDRGREFAYG